MNGPAHHAKGQAQYQRLALAGRLEGASPHGLVSVLYEELLQSLDVIAVAIEREFDRARALHGERAQTILIALGGSLDHASGGSIAVTLDAIYCSIALRLRRSVANADANQIAELRDGVALIAAAWDAIGCGAKT